MNKLLSLRTSFLVLLILPGILVSCDSAPIPVLASPAAALPQASATQAVPFPTPEVLIPSPIVRPAPTKTPKVSPGLASTSPVKTPPGPPAASATPDGWENLPVVPTVSDRARAIYQAGLGQGNNPHAFSKVGDCESQAIWYLTDFDRGPGAYSLGPYDYLQPVIDYFPGSFARISMAAKPSFNAASLMSPLWANHPACQPDESPLACEVRIWRPSLALVMLGTNDSPRPASFEGNLRLVLDYLVSHGVLPVLATKADDLEGNGSINATIARVAAEYDLPLWNYWRATQPLPDHGLQSDGAHLTVGPNRFGDPKAMQSGWAMRNLTALQALDAVWQGVTNK